MTQEGGGCFFFLYLLRSELEIAKEETFNSNAALAHTGESGYLKQELGLRRTFEKLKSGMDLREKEVVDDHWKFNQTRQREFNRTIKDQSSYMPKRWLMAKENGRNIRRCDMGKNGSSFKQ